MAEFEDKVLHELDGIKEYDNAMPGWLMAIWWGSLIFSAAYLIFYALSFGEGSMEAEYRGATQQAVAAVQAYFDANPLVPPSPAELLAGAKDPAVLETGRVALRAHLRRLPRREGAGADRPEPHRRPLDSRRLGRADLPVRREGLAGQGHAAVGPRREAGGTRGARLLREKPPGLEPAERPRARRRPVGARTNPGTLTWATQSRSQKPQAADARAVRPPPRLRRGAGGGSPLQPLGRREAEVHASRRPARGGSGRSGARSRTGCSCSSSLLPLVPVGGHPALQFDIAARRSHVFGGTFYPTDSLILVAFGFGIIVTVFFVGSTFGRMWCGYACPQTV